MRFISPKIRIPIVPLILVLVACGPGPVRGAPPGTREYDVKAAFLLHFAQFVNWPATAFKEANSPLIYCTIGDDPFAGSMDDALRGQTFGSRPIQVQHLKAHDSIGRCHVLFISGSDKKFQMAQLAAAASQPILTVGDTDGFARSGGIVGFLVQDNKVAFEINVGAAGRAQLKIASRLLSLAKSVFGNPD